MEDNEKVLSLYHEVLHAYLEERDIEHVLGCLHECVTWIGTGEHNIITGIEAVAHTLNLEAMAYPEHFHIFEQVQEVHKINCDSYVVAGKYETLFPYLEEPLRLYHRVSMNIERSHDTFKVTHLHMSVADSMIQNAQKRNDMEVRKINFEEKLQERNRFLESFMLNLPNGMHCCRFDENLTILGTSNSFLKMFGYTSKDLEEQFQNSFLKMIYEKDIVDVRKVLRSLKESGSMFEIRFRIRSKEGNLIWVLANGRYVETNGHKIIYSSLLDITISQEKEEKMQLLLERHKIIMDQSEDIIWEWDIANDRMDISNNWQKKFGYEPIVDHVSDALGTSAIIHPEDIPRYRQALRKVHQGKAFHKMEVRFLKESGDYIWCNVKSTTQFDANGKPIRVIGVITDIDEERKQREELMDQAQRDTLTALYNKGATRNVIQSLLEMSKKERHALLIIDMDNFKYVNDTFGHVCGDTLLADVAAALRELFRSNDIIGRIGGDEFVVFMRNYRAYADVERKAVDIINRFYNLLIDNGVDFPITCSIGIALYPKDGKNFQQLYCCADRALYYVKKHEKNGVAFYDLQMEESGCLEDGQIESSISSAIDSNECENVLDQELIRYIFLLLYGAVDTETAIGKIMELVGKSYDVSRVYICESSEDGSLCNNTFEWCNEGIVSGMDKVQQCSYEEDLDDYLENFDENGIFNCPDITILSEQVQTMFADQNIKSLLQCTITDGPEIKGLVGFDDCLITRYWTKDQEQKLMMIANILGTFLLKSRLKEKVDVLKSS